MKISIPTYTISQPNKPSKRDITFISNSLFGHNKATRGEDFKEIAIFIKDVEGKIIAGISALTRWEWAHIDVLWVADEYRRNGFGSMLLELAEKRFREEGCHIIDLDTFSFQAPEFYPLHGYEKVFELQLDNNTKKIFFKKIIP